MRPLPAMERRWVRPDSARPSSRLRSRVRGEVGAASLELVAVFAAVLLLSFSGIQAGMYFFARSVVLAAAQEGVREARVLPVDPSRGVSAAEAYLAQAGGSSLIEPQVVLAVTGTEVTVTVTSQVQDLLGGMLDLSISQTSTGPIERPSR